MTTAGYFESDIVSLGDAIGVNLARFPSIKNWMDRLRLCPSWKTVYEIFDESCTSRRDKEFSTITA